MLLGIPRVGQLNSAAHGAFRDDFEHLDDQALTALRNRRAAGQPWHRCGPGLVHRRPFGR